MLASLRINVYKHRHAKFREAESNFENPRSLLLRLASGFTASSIAPCFPYLKLVDSELLILGVQQLRTFSTLHLQTRTLCWMYVLCLAADVVIVERSNCRSCKLGINTSHQRPTIIAFIIFYYFSKIYDFINIICDPSNSTISEA
jgi:hypothetical protein